jgi:hypothetical protein
MTDLHRVSAGIRQPRERSSRNGHREPHSLFRTCSLLPSSRGMQSALVSCHGVPHVSLNGEITKITIAPYRGSTTLEADVKMLVEGQEIRRRWKSPHTSRTATERWAREKAKSYLTGRAAKEKEPAPDHGRVRRPLRG